MGDEEQRHLAFAGQVPQESHDRGPAGAVEVTRRLVGEEQNGVDDQGAGDGDPLLLAA